METGSPDQLEAVLGFPEQDDALGHTLFAISENQARSEVLNKLQILDQPRFQAQKGGRCLGRTWSECRISPCPVPQLL